jgi:tetratricopeptide (TPR) repeat protein
MKKAAQIFNLPYRRFLTCEGQEGSAARLSFDLARVTSPRADCRSAIPPIANPRYARLLCAIVFFIALTAASAAEPLAPLFDQANKLYEQAKFAEAAAAYEKLIPSDPNSPALYFNLGNAEFKAGESGRAIAAYRRAEMLAPRDPSLRFNLNFVRKKVSGSESAPAENWRHRLANLTLNEWTALAMSAFWLWFFLLALRELRPTLRKNLSGYTATAGVAALVLTGCLAMAHHEQSRVQEAVVVATNAVVRYGPLEESQVFYQLRDGSEVTVLDEKELAVGEKKQSWLQVQDATRRIGWVQRDQVILLATTRPIS